MNKLIIQAKAASKQLSLLSDSVRSEVLRTVADAIEADKDTLLAENALDLAQINKSDPLYDRLQLTERRLSDIAADMRHVATLPSPLGRVLSDKTLANGLWLRRVSVPFGVIGIIYEARPNVTFDVFSLCFKSGNVCLLKGSHNAEHSNHAAVSLIQSVLRHHNISPSVVSLLPSTHEATAELLGAVGYIDLCIPRGGKRLISFVRDHARVPVIETGAGVVHAYFDQAGDLSIGPAIIENAKTRRPSVCNSLDTLLIHHNRLADLPTLCEPLAHHHVAVYADPEAHQALTGHYPADLIKPADSKTFDTEWMDYKIGIRTVENLDEALKHIARHGSGHSECIITGDAEVARRFQEEVDAACVYVNAPTSFTDGAQFGLGAEIGISTQKLGPRGPMGLEEMTTYKWLINGQGQTRK